jgi:hypothetical protein
MPKTTNSLTPSAEDFRKGDKFVKASALYMHWFHFLRVSPSYELARRYRANKGKLSARDKAKLPKDFDKVLKVFDDFGDVNASLFLPWWEERGFDLMATVGKPPRTTFFAKLPEGKQVTFEALAPHVKKYVDENWIKQVRPPVLLVAIPMNAKRSSITKSIKALLDKHHIKKPNPPIAKYMLSKERFHYKTLTTCLKVIWHRALTPKRALWRIGSELGISKEHSKAVNPDARNQRAQDLYARQILEITTSRSFHYAHLIAENAARGIFPSKFDHGYAVDFDKEEFHEILKRSSKWAVQEKARILSKSN